MSTYSQEKLKELLRSEEIESNNIELKQAKNKFSNHDLMNYCAAIANEGGGSLILGVANNGEIVGTQVFNGTLNKLPHKVWNSIRLRVDISELFPDEKRVLIFSIPSRPFGEVIKGKGRLKHPMRLGDSLVEMDENTYKEILFEQIEDLSKKIVPIAQTTDMSYEAIEEYRKLYIDKTGNKITSSKNIKRLLESIGLIYNNTPTYAAFILFGTENSLCKYLPNAEIIFEWRQKPTQIHYDFRTVWRKGLMLIYDEIWSAINARNTRYTYQQGFIQKEILAFDEETIREAVINAIIHRDYTINQKSIIIKANPQKITIESPGGFIPPVNADNILHESAWRNRLLAESVEKTPLIERSGQGVDKIYRNTIMAGKGLPDYSQSTNDKVILSIPAIVKDELFVNYLSKIANQKKVDFSIDQLYELELIRSEKNNKGFYHKDFFLTLGLIEKVSKGRGSRYVLSRKYYEYIGKTGMFTKIKGTNRKVKKQLILQHIEDYGKAKKSDFYDVFPELKPGDINNLLNELAKNKKIVFSGPKRTGFWKLVIN